MATIQEVCERWANLNIDDIIDKSLKDSEQDIITAQIDQMTFGLNADGGHIGQYTPTKMGALSAYAIEKYAQNPLAGEGNVDLIHEGDFVGGLTLEYNQDNVRPFSTDPKNDDLINRYGANTFGLNTQMLSELNQTAILPNLQNNLREAVGL